MPLVNGRYYMNPTYGRKLEQGRVPSGGVFGPIINSLESGSIQPLVDSFESHNSPEPPEHSIASPWNASQGGPEFELAAEQTQNQKQRNTEFSGDATYYNLPGSKTASGHQFDPNKMAAAMTGEKARLGQTVSVAYSYKDAHGNTVTKTIPVVVNDRGPFARNAHGKALHPLKPDPKGVIDLTPEAFRQLAGSLKPGRISVTVTVPND